MRWTWGAAYMALLMLGMLLVTGPRSRQRLGYTLG